MSTASRPAERWRPVPLRPDRPAPAPRRAPTARRPAGMGVGLGREWWRGLGVVAYGPQLRCPMDCAGEGVAFGPHPSPSPRPRVPTPWRRVQSVPGPCRLPAALTGGKVARDRRASTPRALPFGTRRGRRRPGPWIGLPDPPATRTVARRGPRSMRSTRAGAGPHRPPLPREATPPWEHPPQHPPA